MRESMTKTARVTDDDGRLIAELKVSTIFGLVNGYAVDVTLKKAQDEETHQFTAATEVA